MDRLPVELELKAVDVEQRVIEGYAAVFGNLDRVGDVIEPGAFDRTLASKGPSGIAVFVGHNLSSLPVGIPLEVRADEKGLFTRTYIFRTTQGDDLLATAKELLARGKTLGMSIGYRAVRWEWDKDQEGRSLRRLQEVDLIEYSYAAMETIANPEALVVAVKQQQQGLEVKRALPPHTTPKAPEDTPWDGPREVAEADIEDLKIMCAIVQGEGDRKQDYKLPHHRASDHYVVWRGVAAAGAVLMGARGGVDASDEEIEGARRHLERHYQQFDKTPPWSKSFGLGALTDYDAEDWPSLLPLALEHEVAALLEQKAGARMRKEMRELLRQVEEAVRKLREWAEYADEEEGKTDAAADGQGEATASLHRRRLELLAIEVAKARAQTG